MIEKTIAARGMNRDRPQPALAIEPESGRHAEDRADQRRRHIPERQVEDEQRPELDAVDVRFGVESREAVGLGGREESEQRGDAETPSVPAASTLFASIHYPLRLHRRQDGTVIESTVASRRRPGLFADSSSDDATGP